MNKRKDENHKHDWKKKGLGWLPEYPDLRDYSVDDEERLKQDEKTGDIETIAATLLDIVQYQLINDRGFSSKNRELIEDAEDKIRNVLGGVTFLKVKHHKLFRFTSNNVNREKENKSTESNDESQASEQQILILKKYLALLLIGKYFPHELCIQEEENNNNAISEKSEKIEIFRKALTKPEKLINWTARWMEEGKYDLITKKLVKLFQLGSNIYADGVLGLETYTTFNYYLNDENILSDLEDKLKEINKNSGRNQTKIKETKSLSKIRLVSIYPLMPNDVIKKILTILTDRVAKQLHTELSFFAKHIDRFNEEITRKLFEYEFLDSIKVGKEFFERDLQHKWNNAIKSSNNINKDNIDTFLKSCISDNNKIIEVLSKFYVVEPIFASIVKLIYPIAQFREKNLEDIIELGFQEFDKICLSDCDICLSDGDSETANHVNNKELDYSSKRLVDDAIKKVIYLMTMEINSIVENNVPQEKTVIFLCFLVKKYINYFVRKTKATNATNNIFDRQDIFEIIDELISDGNSRPEDTPKDLFPTKELRIPVIDISFTKEIKNIKKTGKVPYCFLPRVVDLSFWCSPVRDQGGLNSCTAFAATALFEYFVNLNFNQNVSTSPLFLYTTARKRMNIIGDVGASIRETIKAMALYGVPPEESWPYEEDKVDEEPPPYTYAYAQNYQALKYFLLDYAGISKESLLFQIKAVLAAGFPCIFGFTVYSSAYKQSNKPGHIPFPYSDKDSVVGGHTVVAVGYDDYKLIESANRVKVTYSKGAILIRNSWGSEWGTNGYGWLPYDYVLAGLTGAWWSLLKSEWFRGDKFGAARSGGEGANEVTGQP